MSEYNSDIDPMRNNAEAKAAEARAVFKGLLNVVGVDIVATAMRAASANQERGQKGITLPAEDRSMILTLDDTGVSFSIDGWGPYKVPNDTAVAAIAEMRVEQAQQPGPTN